MRITVDIEKLMSDRAAFDELVYTPVEKAVEELHERRNDLWLEKRVALFLEGNIPQPFQEKPRTVILRYILTPNYEIREFIDRVEKIKELPLLICEHTEDKFFTNTIKRMLGKIGFYIGRDFKGNKKIDYLRVIDIPKATGKNLSEISTFWGQSLVDFHREFFRETYRKLHEDDTYNISHWHNKKGPKPAAYYAPLMSLFVRHGILFEDFLFADKQERPFLRNVFLPAFITICETMGKKPLISRITSSGVEGDKYWFCYPYASKAFVEKKVSNEVAQPVWYIGECSLGKGVFARSIIEAGQQICAFTGPILTFAQVEAMGELGANAIQVGHDQYVSPDTPGCYLNHSCNPNAGISNDRILIALRKITADEEIRMDYSTTMQENHWKMKCRCGGNNCRKVVADFHLLPEEVQIRYLKLGIVQRFIRAKETGGNGPKLHLS